jgi:hypothetical protein
MPRTPIVGGNWKCNPDSKSKLDALIENINKCDTSACEVYVCPSPLHVDCAPAPPSPCTARRAARDNESRNNSCASAGPAGVAARWPCIHRCPSCRASSRRRPVLTAPCCRVTDCADKFTNGALVTPQNCNFKGCGAYTGEMAVEQMKDLGIKQVREKKTFYPVGFGLVWVG